MGELPASLSLMDILLDSQIFATTMILRQISLDVHPDLWVFLFLSCNKYLTRDYSVAGTSPDAGILALKEMDAVLGFLKPTFWREKRTNE